MLWQSAYHTALSNENLADMSPFKRDCWSHNARAQNSHDILPLVVLLRFTRTGVAILSALVAHNVYFPALLAQSTCVRQSSMWARFTIRIRHLELKITLYKLLVLAFALEARDFILV